MILIFGGTTEGRIAAEVCDKASKNFLYSTRNGDQKLLASRAEQISGSLDSEAIAELCRAKEVKLIIDAAHPFAEILHANIAAAASALSISVVRFERKSTPILYKRALPFATLGEAIQYIEDNDITDIFATTGVKSAAALAPLAQRHNITLRIMDREESNAQIARSGFEQGRVVYYNSDEVNDIAICKELQIKAILTKESGDSGGLEHKIATAEALGIPILVISRPSLPESQEVVFGQFGLRRAIERLAPNFFDLRTGFTTGSAATAATVAAITAQFATQNIDDVDIILPNGEPITIPINRTSREGSTSLSWVVKDGGDDPDATHELEISARVTISPSANPDNCITIRGGEGVGVVKLPGIGVEVGEAAINPVPRAMIMDNTKRILTQYDAKNIDVEIEIIVPRGAEVALKTFNPRLGIEGGISILGTSGIVQPFSSEAFLESIQRQMQIAKALGYSEVAINSGAKSERYVKTYFPDLPPQCYIHYGNLIGDTIALAHSEGIKRVVLGVMLGKAVKLAAGALDTHSKRVVMDRDFILSLAIQAGCSTTQIEQIKAITTARQLWDILPPKHPFFNIVVQNCYTHTKPLLPNGKLEIILIEES